MRYLNQSVLSSAPLLTKLRALLALSVIVGSGSACGPKAFVRGEYDDPTRVELLDDKFNESDMQQMADTVIRSMVACKSVATAPQPPVVIVEKVVNRTEEHIDQQSMTSKIRTSLINSGKVRFINKEERGTLAAEYEYNASGAVSGATQKKKGSQIGADYILSGELAANIQQVGNDKFVYYKLTMNLTNAETNLIDCVAERELRKKYKKQSIGL